MTYHTWSANYMRSTRDKGWGLTLNMAKTKYLAIGAEATNIELEDNSVMPRL